LSRINMHPRAERAGYLNRRLNVLQHSRFVVGPCQSNPGVGTQLSRHRLHRRAHVIGFDSPTLRDW
jgi:hypothetical protein